jgi:hypothetical protein
MRRALRLEMTPSRTFAALTVLAITTVGCLAPTGEESDDSQAAVTQAPQKRHLFVVRTKGFIAPITNATLGSLGGSVADAALYAFSSATNAQFSENPRDGSKTSGDYRLWAQVFLDVKCVGNKVTMELTDADTDAGYEGPLKAGFDPLSTLSNAGGRFSYQARGRPHPAAEPAFQAIASRESNTIWYSVKGHVTCDAQAEATLHLDQVTTTKFPSFRLWVTQHSGFGRAGSEELIVDRKQGNFSELWSLPPPPGTPPL